MLFKKGKENKDNNINSKSPIEKKETFFRKYIKSVKNIFSKNKSM